MRPTKSIKYCYDCGFRKIHFETEEKALNFIRFNADEQTIKDIEYHDDIVMPVLNNVHQVVSLVKMGMNFWDAFHNSALRSGFKLYHEAKDENKYAATNRFDTMIRYIGTKDSTVYKNKLKKCAVVEEFSSCLLQMFDNYNTYYSTIYKDVPYTMFEFLDFILEKEYTMGEDSKAEKIFDVRVAKKMRKFSITFPDGSVVKKKPSDAMECFVRFVGFDAVAAKNTKMISEPFLTQRPSTDVLKNYRALDDGWYMFTNGDTIAKFRLLKFLNETLHVGMKIKLI